MVFQPGVKSTFDNNGTTSRLEIDDGLKYLNPTGTTKILKMIGLDGFTFRNHKYEWRETSLAPRRELITIDNSSTTLTVADAYVYQLDTILRIDAEVVRVTAHASATTLTVTRAYAGTTIAAHTAKYALNMGTARPEGANAVAGLTNNGVPLYNYDQIFERAVSLTSHEIAALSVQGNPLPDQITQRQIELYEEIAQSFWYGVRSVDSVNEIYTMGGMKSAVVTNVTNVGGAVTNAAIDTMILAIVRAGGDPKTISVSPYQAQKLAALDANLQQIGKRERTAGGLRTTSWQSTLLDHDLDIIVDHGILDDELHINDWSHVEMGHLSGNGESGAMAVIDTTANGANRTEKVIRTTLGMKVKLEKGQGYLYGLS